MRPIVSALAMILPGMAAAPLSAQEAGPPRPVENGWLFSHVAPGAHTVYLAGDFNGWARNAAGRVSDPAFAMTRGDGGVWRMTVDIEAEEIRYKFVVADESGACTWHADPFVPEHDGDGNSVVDLAAVSEDASVVETARARLRLFRDSGRMQFQVLDDGGAVVQSIRIPPLSVGGEAQRGFVGTAGGRFRSGAVELAIEPAGDRSIAVRATWTEHAEYLIRVRDNSDYYGGGERFDALNQKGRILVMASIDRPEVKGTVSYKPVPWIMSTRGYGLWLDDFAPSTFDLNASDREHVRVEGAGREVRLVLVAGPRFADLLGEYTALTGRPRVPPAWAFAPWRSRDVHRSRADVIEDVERSRELDLPGTVLVIDSPWETGYNNFLLNERQFPDPDAMFARVAALGYRPVLWLTPFINSRNAVDMEGIEPGASSNFAEASAGGHLVGDGQGGVMISEWWKGEGGLVDFTDPAAVDWWHGQLALTERWGVAGFKCDDGEGNFIGEAEFHDGSPAATMRNRYAALYLEAAQGYIDERLGGDGVLLARPGYAGTQRFPFAWAGDNAADFSHENGLPTAILAAQTASLSGFAHVGSDIAGYIGDQSPELFVRWTQFGAMCPLMMTHMQTNRAPWDFGEEALEIYREFARLHTRLYPMFAEAAREAEETGMPIVRPMVLAFQDDAVARRHIFQFMVGDSLLAAPLYQPGTHRGVYLPAGEWIDFWSGERHEGPREFEVHAPLHRMPLFVRAGAVLPLLPEDVDTLVETSGGLDSSVTPLDDRRVIEVWPGEGSLDSSEGLRASVSPTGELTTFRLESATDRPLRIDVAHAEVAIAGESPRVESCEWDAGTRRTRITLSPATGAVELRWRRVEH